MKLSTRTILKNIIDNVISEWQQKVPDKKLDEYDNWRTDILDRIEFKLKKQNMSLDEIIIDTTEKPIENVEKPTETRGKEAT